ncbi:Syntaxin-7 [Balamuthia mandrillaris]
MASDDEFGAWGKAKQGQAGSGSEAALLDRIADQLQQLSRNVSQLKELSQKLGTRQDNDRLRQDLSRLREETTDLAKRTREDLYGGDSERRWKAADVKSRAKRDRLGGQFRDLLQDYERAAQLSLKKEREAVQVIEETVNHRKSMKAGRYDDDDDDSDGKGFQMKMKELGLDDVDVDEKLIRERNEQIHQIELDLQELGEVFRDVSTLVHDQGEILTTVETQASTAKANTDYAVEELEVSNKLQCAARRKMCCLGIIVTAVVVVILIILIVVLVTQLKKD